MIPLLNLIYLAKGRWKKLNIVWRENTKMKLNAKEGKAAYSSQLS